MRPVSVAVLERCVRGRAGALCPWPCRGAVSVAVLGRRAVLSVVSGAGHARGRFQAPLQVGGKSGQQPRELRPVLRSPVTHEGLEPGIPAGANVKEQILPGIRQSQDLSSAIAGVWEFHDQPLLGQSAHLSTDRRDVGVQSPCQIGDPAGMRPDSKHQWIVHRVDVGDLSGGLVASSVHEPDNSDEVVSEGPFGGSGHGGLQGEAADANQCRAPSRRRPPGWCPHGARVARPGPSGPAVPGLAGAPGWPVPGDDGSWVRETPDPWRNHGNLSGFRHGSGIIPKSCGLCGGWQPGGDDSPQVIVDVAGPETLGVVSSAVLGHPDRPREALRQLPSERDQALRMDLPTEVVDGGVREGSVIQAGDPGASGCRPAAARRRGRGVRSRPVRRYRAR